MYRSARGTTTGAVDWLREVGAVAAAEAAPPEESTGPAAAPGPVHRGWAYWPDAFAAPAVSRAGAPIVAEAGSEARTSTAMLAQTVAMRSRRRAAIYRSFDTWATIVSPARPSRRALIR